MSLQTIELELLRTLPSLNLRPRLEAAQTAGKLLEQARDLVPHGQWLQFLARIGLTQRTAHDYVTVHRHAGDQRPAATMTIKQFLVQVRDARRRERLAERSRVRAEVAARKGKLDEDVVLVNKDCKNYEWPKQVDAVRSVQKCCPCEKTGRVRGFAESEGRSVVTKSGHTSVAGCVEQGVFGGDWFCPSATIRIPGQLVSA